MIFVGKILVLIFNDTEEKEVINILQNYLGYWNYTKDKEGKGL